MRKSLGVCVFVLTTLASVSSLFAKTEKNSDSSTLATPPAYNQTGVVGTALYGDYHASFTGADGQTTDVTCTSSVNSTDCNEGSGVGYWITLPDKRKLYFSGRYGLPVDLDHDRGGDFAYVSSADPLRQDSNGKLIALLNGRTITFRFRTASEAGEVRHYFCMPITVDLHGKKREAYAKHHSMEACYDYY
jgi:hypothetical protein